MPYAQIRGASIHYEILGDKGPWMALSPGGRAASLGILFQVHPDLGVPRPRTASHRLPLPKPPLPRLGPAGRLLQRLCTRLSSRFNSNFCPQGLITGQIRLS